MRNSKKKRDLQSAKDLIYGELKRGIVTLEIAPGSALEEHDVVRHAGFSRTPFREACMRLKEEGWVLPISRRGYIVAPIELSDISDVSMLRFILESASAQIAASRVTEKDIEFLEELLRVEEQQEETGPQRASALLDMSFRFHLFLAELTGNARLVTIMRSILERTERFGWMVWRTNPGLSWDPHSRIVAALKERNPLEARKRIEEHLEITKQHIVNACMGHTLVLSPSSAFYEAGP